jgi:hypothetical protein
VIELPAELRFAVAPIIGIDVRSPQGNFDNTWSMSGALPLFDSRTVIFDGAATEVSEHLTPDAIERVLAEQPFSEPEGIVRVKFGVDVDRAIAATDIAEGPGSLIFRVRPGGLWFLAKVPRGDQEAVTMAAKLKSYVLSWSIVGVAAARVEDGQVLEVGRLFDLATTAERPGERQIRAYAASLGLVMPDAARQAPAPAGMVEPAGLPAPRRLPAQLARSIAEHRTAHAELLRKHPELERPEGGS